MRKLLIDRGHSKRFRGARGVADEMERNQAVLEAVVPLFDRSKWDILLVPTDYRLDFTGNAQLVHRIKWINAHSSPSDWLLSIHGNAAANPSVRGVTTCYFGGSSYAEKEAKALSQAIAGATGMPVWGGGSFDDRNGRFGRIGMVRDTTPLAMLIEAGFVTSKEDMSIEPNSVAIGIASFFNGLPV